MRTDFENLSEISKFIYVHQKSKQSNTYLIYHSIAQNEHHLDMLPYTQNEIK